MARTSRSLGLLPVGLAVLIACVAVPLGCERSGDGGGDGRRLSRERGGDPPTGPVNPKSEPPIVVAARAGDAARVRGLAGRGADVNAFGKGRRTALMAAAAHGRAEVVDVLLELGADANLRDAKGDTAAEVAAARGHRPLAESLRKAEVKPPRGPAKPIAAPKPQPKPQPAPPRQ
jgi:hypothetical protein